jgi:hypothetical protein
MDIYDGELTVIIRYKHKLQERARPTPDDLARVLADAIESVVGVEAEVIRIADHQPS